MSNWYKKVKEKVDAGDNKGHKLTVFMYEWNKRSAAAKKGWKKRKNI